MLISLRPIILLIDSLINLTQLSMNYDIFMKTIIKL